MSSSKLVAFIISAGTNISTALAVKLRENGYRVALGSRSPKPDAEHEGYVNVKVDAQNRETASAHPIPNNGEFLSLSREAYDDATAIGLGAFTAAQKALVSFRDDVHRNNPKAFIVTGKFLPFDHYSPPNFYTLGAQKALEARLVATAAKSYESENIQFYFASLVSETGGITGTGVFGKSGPTHAKVYWDLINNKKQADWNHRFTADGKVFTNA